FRFEFVDGKVINPYKPHALLHNELGRLRIEINELLVKFSILPVFGIFCLEENTLHSAPVEPLELFPAERGRAVNFEHATFSGKCFERKLLEPLAGVDHVEGSIDMRARMRAHLDGGQSNRVRLVARWM